MSAKHPESHSFHLSLKWVSLLLLVVVSMFFFFHEESKADKPKKSPQAPEVPVETTSAEKGDMKVYVDALGTVTPLASVSVVSRVQGQILKVNYQEGQMVKPGDSLVEIDPAPYEASVSQAEGQLAKDQAVLKEASIDLERYRRAYKLRAISKQQFEDQEQIVVQDQAVVKSDQGVLQNAKINLSYCHIQSPIAGRVGLRLIDAGNMVQANSTTPLVVVTQINPIAVVFSVAEDYLAQIHAGMQNGQVMPVDAFDRANVKRIAVGTFLTLDNTIDTATGTVKVKALFKNEDGALFPNQFVNARLLLSTESNQTLLSNSAIQRNAQGPFVYVIGPDQKAKLQPIKVGSVDEQQSVVQGISAGDVVAANGFDKLQDGAKVKVQEQAQMAKGDKAHPDEPSYGKDQKEATAPGTPDAPKAKAPADTAKKANP